MQQQERREFERYPYPGDRDVIAAEIVWAKTADIDPHDVRFIDISRAGLGIISGNIFAVGDSLKIRISLAKTEPLDIVAIVCNRRQAEAPTQGDRAPIIWRYGLYFEYDSQLDSLAVEVLSRLDEEVRRYHWQPV